MSEAATNTISQEYPMEASSPIMQPDVNKHYCCPFCDVKTAWPTTRALHILTEHGAVIYNRDAMGYERLWSNGAFFYREFWYYNAAQPESSDLIEAYEAAIIIEALLVSKTPIKTNVGIVFAPDWRGC